MRARAPIAQGRRFRVVAVVHAHADQQRRSESEMENMLEEPFEGASDSTVS